MVKGECPEAEWNELIEMRNGDSGAGNGRSFLLYTKKRQELKMKLRVKALMAEVAAAHTRGASEAEITQLLAANLV